jgi:hydroxymethylbilane synthase
VTRVRIATRGSELALWQARYVAGRIESEVGAETQIVPLKTKGDRIQNVSLAKIGGKGLFVKEIEEALLDGRADVAVHSAKDLPAMLHPELPLVAFPERADPRDAWVAREAGVRLSDLPSGARVGTGSVRRSAQLRRQRPDLEIVPLRGNVATRLGLAERITEPIAPEVLLPSVAQGALAVQARADTALAQDLAALDDPASARRVVAERAFQARLGGDCSVPLAALAESRADALRLRGLVIALDGSRVAEAERVAPASEAERAGEALAEAVLRDGGAEILEVLRSGSPA